MPNFQLPKGLPALPRMPQLVTPRSGAPGDMVAAAASTEADVIRALVKEPASALGITLPDIPGPASILAQMLPPIGGQGGQGGQGTETKPAPSRIIKMVFE